MKRLGFVVAIAALVAGAVWYSMRASRPALDAAGLLPANTAVLVLLPDVHGMRDDWQHSDLYELYREPAVQAFLGKPLSKLPQRDAVNSARDDFEQLDVRTAFVAAATTEPLKLIGGLEYGGSEEAARAVVARWKARLTQTSFAAKEYAVDYEGHQLDVIGAGQTSVASTFVRRRFYFATDVEHLKALLDRLDGRDKTGDLARDSGYRAALAHMPAEYALLAFARPEAIKISGLPGATAICHATRFDAGKMRDVTFVARPKTSGEEITRGAVRFGTADTFLYLAAAMNPAAAAQQSAPPTPILTLLSRVTAGVASAGVTADEWNAAFGSELSLLGDWRENARWPAALLVAPVKDAARADAIAARAAASMWPAPWQTRERNGVRYHTLSTPTGLMVLNPTIAISPKWLVCGLDAGAVDAALQRVNSGGELEKSKAYRASTDVAMPGTMFAYADLALLYRRIDASLRPLLQMTSALMPAVSDQIDVSKLPPADVVAKHLTPLVASRRYDRDGYVTESAGTVTVSEAALAGLVSGTAGAAYGQSTLPFSWPQLFGGPTPAPAP